MDILSLLRLLSDGEYHTGSEMGDKLGVSRTAIWKALNKLSELQLVIEKSKSKGYRIQGGLELLDHKQIESAMAQAHRDRVNVDLHLSVESTNQTVKDMLASASDSVYQIALAEMQTSGRGRRGKSWCSPFGQNLYLSLGFDLEGGVEKLSGLSLVVGIGVVRAVRSMGEIDARLKWPNDIWVNDQKLCGILIELQGEATTAWQIVAGVGVNVLMSSDAARDIDQPWTSLSEHMDCSRNQFAALLVSHLVDVLDVYKSSGWAGFQDEWDQYDALKGRSVKLLGSDLEGEVLGVDMQGALLIRARDGSVLPVNAGEVSVRINEV